MKDSDLAFQLGQLFDSKVVAFYRNTYKGTFGQVQIQVLSDLSEHQPSKLQDVAERVSISKQHASKILLRFEELGYVIRQEDRTDRRAKLFQLSPSGEKLIREHIDESNRHFEEMLETLDPAEQQEMSEAMKVMIALLGKM